MVIINSRSFNSKNSLIIASASDLYSIKEVLKRALKDFLVKSITKKSIFR